MLVVIVCALASFPIIHHATAYEVSFGQIIREDTVWTKANSPYSLTGNVLVSNGATLTIEAGVTVNFYHYIIQVNGTLKVQGSNSDKVVFTTANRIINNAHDQLGGINFGDESSDCIIENTILETMEFTYYNCRNSITINNNYFKDQRAETNSGSISVLPTIRGSGNATITNNIFTGRVQLACSASVINNTFIEGGVDASDGSFLFLNNTLTGSSKSPYADGFGIGVDTFQRAVISDNYISNYMEACIRMHGQALIQRNVIENKPYMDGYPFFGIEVDGSSPLIENNTITNTGIGIDIYNQGVIETKPTIINNNIFNNRDANLFLGYPERPGYNTLDYSANSNIDASNNWWGTTDNQAISQTIHDSKDRADLGTVNFTPFLTAPNSQAVPNPNAPTPTLQQVSTARFLQATKDDGQKIDLTVYGNSKIMWNAKVNITTNLLAATANVTFVVRGDEGTSDFFNMTIPKSAVPYGDKPTVYTTGDDIGDLLLQDQGYSQDTDNYYVWCTTHFDGYFYGGLTIEFTNSQAQSLIPIIAVGVLVIIVAAALTILIYTKKKKNQVLPV